MNDKLDEVLKEILSLQKELEEEFESFRTEVRRGFDDVGKGFITTGRMILRPAGKTKKAFLQRKIEGARR
jgi:hypothetical protein